MEIIMEGGDSLFERIGSDSEANAMTTTTTRASDSPTSLLYASSSRSSFADGQRVDSTRRNKCDDAIDAREAQGGEKDIPVASCTDLVPLGDSSSCSAPPPPPDGSCLSPCSSLVACVGSSTEGGLVSCVFVQNIIASVNLDINLDLRLLTICIRNAEYNPRKVNAVILRLRAPKCTVLIFHSGRMMVTGASGDSEAKLGARKAARLVQLVTKSSSLKFRGFKVENLIASADVGVPIRLEGLARDHHDFCCYEPELFAGLVYRFNPCGSPVSAVLLIFVSGKVVITGCKTKGEAQMVFETIHPVVLQYQS